MELTKHENIGTVASSKLYSAFPFTLCIYPQNLSYTPKFEKSSILLYNGRTKKIEQSRFTPSFKMQWESWYYQQCFHWISKQARIEKKNVFIYRPTRSHYNLMFQCTKCQHWFHPECQDIKLKACQLNHSRSVGCFECWLKWKLACSNWVNVINLF